MIQALLFDAAGTLIEPAEPVGSTYARILGQHGFLQSDDEWIRRFPDAFRNAGEPNYGRHPDGDLAEREWWKRVVDLTAGNEVAAEAFDELFHHYAHGSAWRIRPDAVSALDTARENGFRLAVVSNFDLRLHRILADLGLAPYFEVITTSAEARARKPSARIFHHALDRLGLQPAETMHVGDSEPADGIGGRSAGIETVVLGSGLHDLRSFVDLAISQNRREPPFEECEPRMDANSRE